MNTTDTTVTPTVGGEVAVAAPVAPVAPYGFKLDGVTPKRRPGRRHLTETGKDSKTMKTVYLLNGQILGVGKPSVADLRARTFVKIPKNQDYDAEIHGVGVRPEKDDARADEIEANRAARVAAKAAAALAKAEAAKNAAAAATPAPAGPSIGEGSVAQNVDVAPVAASSEVVTESETTTL